MFTSKKWQHLDLIHDFFSTPMVARISNRLICQKYFEIGQRFLFVVHFDNSTEMLPLTKGVSTTQLSKNARMLFHVTNNKEKLNFSEVSYAYAMKLLRKPPVELTEIQSSLAEMVAQALITSFHSDALPDVDLSEKENWSSLCFMFQNQQNDVMTHFLSKAISLNK